MENKRKLSQKICAIGLASAMVLAAPVATFANGNGNGGKGAEKGQQQSQKLENKQEKAQQKSEQIKQKKEEIIKSYTAEEINQVNETSKKIKNENKGIKVLPINSVVSKKGKMKFDTPPVIKGGRTLIPVRAITQGLGADVKWDEVTREVTISKGDITIVIQIDSRVVYVNGEKVEIDAPAEILSKRTYVPLRFIAETFNLKVNWDEETETIEIDDEEEEEAVEPGEELEEEQEDEEEEVDLDQEENDEDEEENDEDEEVDNGDEEVIEVQE